MKYPLKGHLIGADARTDPGSKYQAFLRETKLYYITEGGIKFRKSDGSQTGEDCPLYILDLCSIKPRIVL